MKRFEQLEALVADLGLEQSELENWLLFRDKRRENKPCVPPLPIVYCCEDELYLSLEIDRQNEDEVFGWMLDDGLIMCRPNLLDKSVVADYKSVCAYATGRFFSNFRTLLASITQVTHAWDLEQKLKVKATMDLLAANGIDCGCLQNVKCWCADDVSASRGHIFSLMEDTVSATEQDAVMVIMLTV